MIQVTLDEDKLQMNNNTSQVREGDVPLFGKHDFLETVFKTVSCDTSQHVL